MNEIKSGCLFTTGVYLFLAVATVLCIVGYIVIGAIVAALQRGG